jgi:hypothetical protein
MSLVNYLLFWNPGKQVEKSLLGNLQTLTPEIAEDVEDLQSVESMTISGALGSGTFRIYACVIIFIFFS